MAKAKLPVEHTYEIEGAVSDGFGALEELGSEMRERFDNAPENLQQTDTNQRVSEAADTLEGLSQPDVPDCIAGVDCSFKSVPNKRTSRAARRDDAIEILDAAKSAAESWLEENEEIEVGEDIPDGDGGEGATKKATDEDVQERESLRGEVETFIQEMDDLISEASDVEFPGMFG